MPLIFRRSAINFLDLRQADLIGDVTNTPFRTISAKGPEAAKRSVEGAGRR